MDGETPPQHGRGAPIAELLTTTMENGGARRRGDAQPGTEMRGGGCASRLQRHCARWRNRRVVLQEERNGGGCTMAVLRDGHG
ncbi:Gag-Pol polyprotein [Sesbania bispinosa]|nr:Gag-Pol polyprotein [Sesbania bispinosa]